MSTNRLHDAMPERERADEVMYVESSGVWVRWLDFERQKFSIHGSSRRIEARPTFSEDPDEAHGFGSLLVGYIPYTPSTQTHVTP